LFAPAKVGSIRLSNHLVMAPMTRCRAIGNIPNALMADYYSQRAGAGLIITEGTSPSPNGLGYARIPGMFSKAQRLEKDHRGGACQGREDIRSVDAHGKDKSSPEYAGGVAHPGSVRRAGCRADVDGYPANAGFSDAGGNDCG